MARTLEQILEQEKIEVVAKAKRKASEMLAIMDKQTAAQQNNEVGSEDSPSQK